MPKPRPDAEVRIRIPSSLRPLCGGQSVVRVSGGTVGEALVALEKRWPDLRARLRDQHGRLRPQMLVVVNTEDIRAKQGESTPVAAGDELRIVPTIEGG